VSESRRRFGQELHEYARKFAVRAGEAGGSLAVISSSRASFASVRQPDMNTRGMSRTRALGGGTCA